MEENNFYTVCNDILQEGNNNINTRGWIELHRLLILMLHAYNDNNDEWEVRVTGSSIENSQIICPDDIGDLDVMISKKKAEHVIQQKYLKNIPLHPGFVKVKATGEEIAEENYVKSSSLNGELPELLMNIIYILHKYWNDKQHCEFSLEQKKCSPANTIQMRTNFPSVDTQWRNADGINNLQLGFFQNFSRLSNNSSDKIVNLEELIATLTSDLQKMSSDPQSKDVLNLIKMVKNLSATTAERIRENNMLETPASVDSKVTNEHDLTQSGSKKEGCSNSTESELLSEGEATEYVYKSKNIENPIKDLLKESHQIATDEDVGSGGIKEKFQDFVLQSVLSRVILPNDKKDFEQRAEDISSVNKTKRIEAELPRKIGLDLVMATKIESWPEIAAEFCIRSEREWPSSDLLIKVLESSIYIVTKHPDDISEDLTEFSFRLSFSHAEQLLCNSMNETQIMCYRAMKLLSKFLFKKVFNGETSFSSYHIKTLLFWAIERNKKETWNKDNLEDCMCLLLSNLLNALEEKTLENYFIRDMNLFKYFTVSEIDELKECVILIICDMMGTFKKIKQSFEENSRKVSVKLNVSKPDENEKTSDIIPNDDTCMLTFYQRWSTIYDEMTLQFIDEVFSDVSNSSTQREFSNNLLETFKRSEMSRDMIAKLCSTFKMGAFNKHALSLKDALRPVKEIVKEDIYSLGDFVKYMIRLPAADMTEENAMQMIIEGVRNNDEEAIGAIDAFMPDTNDMMDTITKCL